MRFLKEALAARSTLAPAAALPVAFADPLCVCEQEESGAGAAVASVAVELD